MRGLLIIIALCSAALLSAKELQPQMHLDTTVLRIGEQAKLTLSVTYRIDQNRPRIVFPEIGDVLSENVEVVSVSEIDSSLQAPDEDPYLMVQRQRIVVTSWDSGFWAIPPFVFNIHGKEVETEAELLEVQGIAVDTAQAYKDITDIERLPFSFAHWLKEHWQWIAGAVGILALAYFLLLFLKSRPKKVAPPAPVHQAPLHVRTLERLEEIQRQKLWQKGRTKFYYSEVTEALRAYVEERFNVPALERTTHELKRELKMSTMPRAKQEELIANLEHADMVKFAKYKPIASENEALLENAFRFVKDTSFTEAPTLSPHVQE